MFSVSSFDDKLSPQSDGSIVFALIFPNIFSLVAESTMPLADLLQEGKWICSTEEYNGKNMKTPWIIDFALEYF